jgi:hypothetical protein
MPFLASCDTQKVDGQTGHIQDLSKADTTPVRHVEDNFANLRAVGIRVIAQLDSRECYEIELLETEKVVEHVPRGTRIDHNCLRVNFVTNVVRSCNGGCSAVELIAVGGRVCVVEAIAAVIAAGRCCPCAVLIVVAVFCEAVAKLVIFLTSTFVAFCGVTSTSLAVGIPRC